jgi:hypothetical protein
MNTLEKLILATAAIIYGMTAQLPANETIKETQEAINKWYDEVSTSISKDITALGVTIENLPNNISVGVSNFVEESIQFQKEGWAKGMEQNQQNWDYIKSLFVPKTEEAKK